MSILLQHTIRKGDFLLDIDTRIPATGITGVFGESGSGKTSLLRCVSGLEQATSSDGVPVHKRRIGFVFQEPQLFSHLSVRKNIEFGMRRNPAAEISVDEVTTMLEIDSLLDRSIADLSGGEAQRVSIARVLCQSPELILMDEPLSSLDERRRNDVLPYLDRLHAESAVPIIYVSHNIDEICRLSDHLLILDHGKIVAEGALQDVLARTDLPQLRGGNAGVVIDATASAYDDNYDLTLFRFSGGELWVPGHHEPTSVRLRISASDISLCRMPAESSTILNVLPVVVEATCARRSTSHGTVFATHCGLGFGEIDICCLHRSRDRGWDNLPGARA